MEIFIQLFLTFGVTIGLMALGLFVGRSREAKHHADLLVREQALQGTFVVSQLKVLPDWAASGALATGSAVIASDYFKSFAAQIRGIFGGEVKSFQTLMARARREALLRAVDEARSQGGVGLANVRFETSNISSGAGRQGMVAVEIFCFGTALIPARQAAPTDNLAGSAVGSLS